MTTQTDDAPAWPLSIYIPSITLLSAGVQYGSATILDL